MKDHIKLMIDGVSVSTIIGTLLGWLPALAALASFIWTCIRIYETRTVQRWLGREEV